MFGIGTTELIIILLVALVVLGPAKLPGIARSLGKALGEFRRVTTDVQRTLNLEAARIEEDEREKAKKSASEKKDAANPVPAEAETDACVPPPQCVDPAPARAAEQKDSIPKAGSSSSTPASPDETSIPGTDAQPTPAAGATPAATVSDGAGVASAHDRSQPKDQA